MAATVDMHALLIYGGVALVAAGAVGLWAGALASLATLRKGHRKGR